MSTRDRLINKVAEAFAKLGIHAECLRMEFPTGYWKAADVYRWESYWRLSYADGRQPETATLNSWDTATECVKKGDMQIDKDRKSVKHYEVYAPSSLVK